MKLKLDGVTYYVGKRREDGRRNIERVKLDSWRSQLPKLREAKIAARMNGQQFSVRLMSDSQMLLSYLQETA